MTFPSYLFDSAERQDAKMRTADEAHAEAQNHFVQAVRLGLWRNGRRYVIKCDDCKETIGHTDNTGKSAAGGRCQACATS